MLISLLPCLKHAFHAGDKAEALSGNRQRSEEIQVGMCDMSNWNALRAEKRFADVRAVRFPAAAERQLSVAIRR